MKGIIYQNAADIIELGRHDGAYFEKDWAFGGGGGGPSPWAGERVATGAFRDLNI